MAQSADQKLAMVVCLVKLSQPKSSGKDAFKWAQSLTKGHYIHICIHNICYINDMCIYVYMCIHTHKYICLFIYPYYDIWVVYLFIHCMGSLTSTLFDVNRLALILSWQEKNAAKVSETKKNEAFHHKDGCVKNRKGSVAFTKSRWHSLRASMRQASSLNLLRRTVVKTSLKKIIMYHCLEKR